MLTSSGNQYLRPDYLQPLPTTLDAKKSPLALLAQTCSSIGQPDPPAQSKTIIPPIEKKESEKSSSDKSSSEEKSSFKPYEQIKKEDPDNEPKSGFRTPINSKNTPVTSQSSSAGEKSPIPTSTTDSLKSSESTAVTTVIQNPLSASVPSTPGIHSHNRISLSCGSMFVEVNHHESAALAKDGVAIQSSHLNPMPSYKPGQLMSLQSPATLAHSNCAGCAQVIGHTIPMDPTGGSPYQTGLTTSNGLSHPVSTSPIKHSNSIATPALSPYVAYARVKTASGGTTLVPICRDPYCTNCQLSLQSAQLTTCPSGCTQCNHEAQSLSNAMSLSGLQTAASLTPVSSASGGSSLPLSSYPHSVFAHRPYVCNWIAGDAYCGKRFTTSEELLQHLRTHTNLSTSDASSLPLITPSYSLGLQTAAGLNGCHMHYSSATAYGSPSLRRTYPTSLSPVSSLSASRYHPYKTQLPPLPGAPMPHPTIAPYYSPYALYGPRMGAVAHQ